MNINELKEKISKANIAYRNGNEIMSDQEYDSLLSILMNEIGWEEYNEFVTTLTEEKGNDKFDYVIGSLNKIKYENTGDFSKWQKKENIGNKIFISEKIDGCSGLLFYKNGKFIKAYSRGDGQTGSDWTDKALQICSIPKQITHSNSIYIRGEFTLTGNDYKLINGKNLRNSTVGLMNQKQNSTYINLVHFFAYEVLSENWNIVKQFQFLESEKFITPNYLILDV